MKNSKITRGVQATLAIGLVIIGARGFLGGESWETRVCHDPESIRPGQGSGLTYFEPVRKLSDEWLLFPTSIDGDNGSATSALLLNPQTGEGDILRVGDEARKATGEGNSVFVGVDEVTVFAGVTCENNLKDLYPDDYSPGRRK